MGKEFKPIYNYEIRLTTSNQVRVMLSRVANALIQDEISEERARALTYISNTILSSIKQGDMEDRIKELEDHLFKSNDFKAV